uniref:UPF0497 membrane protein At5g62820 family n=1 Tax=Cajanus cajan TaxID=3821 RepID=A0A151SNE8_CAJCA|nr:UPF0497 membrane protein At5g62820 family [Cajanus cajan]
MVDTAKLAPLQNPRTQTNANAKRRITSEQFSLERRKLPEAVSKAVLGFRLSEVVVCLISFSVMAADKMQGWSVDSYDLYREYRY